MARYSKRTRSFRMETTILNDLAVLAEVADMSVNELGEAMMKHYCNILLKDVDLKNRLHRAELRKNIDKYLRKESDNDK